MERYAKGTPVPDDWFTSNCRVRGTAVFMQDVHVWVEDGTRHVRAVDSDCPDALVYLDGWQDGDISMPLDFHITNRSSIFDQQAEVPCSD